MYAGFEHILVVYDGSAAAKTALADAMAISDEHEAEISVVALVDHEPPGAGCARCGLGQPHWNDVMDDMAEADLAEARQALADHPGDTHFEVVSGSGPSGIRGAVARFGCDLVLVPAHGPLPGLLAHRLKRRVTAGVVSVRAA